MTPDLKTDDNVSLTPLVKGIVEDAQTLITQQLSLFQSEVQADLVRTKTAAIPLVIGMAASLLAGFFLFMMVVRLMTATWPQLPDYAALGIVGAALAIVGGVLLAFGLSQLDKIGLLANRAVNSLKENVRWKTQK